ncbi:MAG TPA: MBL fold metallo-hydrolase [Clostridia bacterium]|nr:MBL fold metallo-hydrolase [Clostridia bacterium]
MKLKYLGTAAAEGIPALFCFCPVCQKSEKAKGPNIRTRSQAIIDNKILVDLPPDTYFHVLNGGLDLKNITTLLVTHSHSDHLYAKELEFRKHGFAYTEEGEKQKPLNIYCTDIAGESIRDIIEKGNLDENVVKYTPIEAFKPFKAEGYTITPYKANHDKHSGPVFYSISDGEKTMLYANDTGYFPEETWAELEKSKQHFNFVSLDCTGIILDYRDGHMGINACGEVKQRLIEIGCADEKTTWCYHHFSHNGLLTHDEFLPVAKEHGFLVSYDGMEVEI